MAAVVESSRVEKVGEKESSSARLSKKGRGLDGEELRRLQVAHEGMRLLLSSQVKQAECLFRKSRFTGPELNAGFSFVQLVRSLMTFEDDAMDAAYKSLEATEKFCDTSRKFSAIFSSGGSSSSQRLTAHQRLYRKSIVADCLLFEAIIVFIRQSLTSYVKGGYLVRKAWKLYEKVFNETERLCLEPSPITKPGVRSPTDKHVGSSVYDDKSGAVVEEGVEEEEEGEEGEGEGEEVMAELGATIAMTLGLSGGMEEGEGEGGGGGGKKDMENGEVLSSSSSLSTSRNGSQESAATSTEQREGGRGGTEGGGEESPEGETKESIDGVKKKKSKKRPSSGYDLPEPLPEWDLITDLGHEDDRLRGAVYFGYGIMNIVISLIPPKLMKLANLFGFSGDRRLGLQALEFASHSPDMKAPLARIALLWYHTIVRPFFALDGEQEDAGAEEAERLLKEAESLYPNSALFLYFKGKVLYLRRQLNDALAVYTSAASLSRDQREIEHIALYEKGWIHFLQLNYAESLPCYIRLKNETRWSACFYAYLCAAMTGVMGDLKESRELFLQSARLVKRKNNNLEKFCFRRAQLYKKGVTFHMPLEARLMIIEVFYLWRALPFCSEDAKLQMIEMLDLALPPDALTFHKAMRAWLRGGVLNSLNRRREAEKSLREALEYEPDIKHDKHIISFSLYEIAMIHIANTEYAKARTVLNFAKEAYTGYEFEARLNFKVHSALNSIR